MPLLSASAVMNSPVTPPVEPGDASSVFPDNGSAKSLPTLASMALVCSFVSPGSDG